MMDLRSHTTAHYITKPALIHNFSSKQCHAMSFNSSRLKFETPWTEYCLMLVKDIGEENKMLH
jgi:hypothetical protein